MNESGSAVLPASTTLEDRRALFTKGLRGFLDVLRAAAARHAEGLAVHHLAQRAGFSTQQIPLDIAQRDRWTLRKLARDLHGRRPQRAGLGDPVDETDAM